MSQVRMVDAPKQRKVYQSIMRQMDAVENKARPDVVISGHAVRLGVTGKFATNVSTVVLHNCSYVNVDVSYINRERIVNKKENRQLKRN